MDKYLENQLNELGEAINDAIQESPEVQKILDRIRATGNEVMLAIEASITRSEESPSLDLKQPRKISIEDRLKEFSNEDRKFLQSLNIKLDNDE
jgi:hypothetical protein